jgi:hypothetical protein
MQYTMRLPEIRNCRVVDVANNGRWTRWRILNFCAYVASLIAAVAARYLWNRQQISTLACCWIGFVCFCLIISTAMIDRYVEYHSFRPQEPGFPVVPNEKQSSLHAHRDNDRHQHNRAADRDRHPRL